MALIEFDSTEEDDIKRAVREELEDGVPEVNTDELFTDGDILAFGTGNGLIERFDPGDSTTPVQDAIDAVESVGGGRVVLPTGTISESGTISRTNDGVSLVGPGIDACTIECDGLVNNGARRMTTGGFTVDCLDTANGNAGWSFDGGVHGVQVSGGLKFANCQHVIDIASGSNGPHASFWDYVQGVSGSDGYHGHFLNIPSGNGPALHIGTAYMGNEDSSVEVKIGDIASDTDAAPVGVRIGTVNVGGTPGPFLHERTPENALIEIGQVNYEPRQAITISEIFQFDGYGNKHIGPIRPNGNVTTDYVYRLGPDRALNVKEFHEPRETSMTTNNNVVAIDAGPFGSHYSFYYGESADIDNNAGSASGNVRALGSAGTGNG